MHAATSAPGKGSSRSTSPDIAPHRPALREYLARFLPEAEVEDAVQTVLETALLQQGHYRAEQSPRAWLLGIARALIDARPKSEAPAELPADPSEPVADEGPEVALSYRQQLGRVLSAMEGLSLDEKLALLICYVDEIPGRQAAHLLGISHDAFRQRLSRARRTLVARLEEASGDLGRDTAAIESWRSALNPSGDR